MEEAGRVKRDSWADLIAFVATGLGWLAVFTGASHLWDRPLAYLLGGAALVVSILAIALDDVRLGITAAILGAIGVVASIVVVVVVG